MTVKGELQTADHTVWIQKRREIEASRAPSSNAAALHSDEESTGEVEPDNFTSTPIGAVGGLRPNSGDVLFGRGRAIIDHPGNAQFRQIVDHYMLKYEASGRLQKTCIADIIVRLVKNSCGRFLKKNEDGSWDEVDDSAARKKVAHAFRNRRKIPSLEKSS